MLRKFSFAVALAAAVMFSPAAIAGRGHGGHGHGGHGGHGHGGHGHGGHGHGGHGHGGTWQNTATGMVTHTGIIIIGTTAIDTVTVVIGPGRWYGYGVGACWRWTPGGYVWICY